MHACTHVSMYACMHVCKSAPSRAKFLHTEIEAYARRTRGLSQASRLAWA